MNTTISRFPLAPSGRRRLQEELDRLCERLGEATDRLRDELRETDDLSWYLTQEELAQIRTRIGELQAALVDERDAGLPFEEGVVGPGSRVLVQDEAGREHSFLIVTSIETDAARGYISLDSPVGAALLGRRPSESVSVSVPRGERHFTVLHVGASTGGGA